jgi:DNA-binding protein YbaB
LIEPANMAAEAEDLERIAGQMRRTADGINETLAAVAATAYEVTSANSEVTVVTDGRPRITTVRIDPRAMRLDPGTLSRLLTETLNTGLHTAREGGQAAFLADLDPATRETLVEGMSLAGPGPDTEPGRHGDDGGSDRRSW